MKLNLASLAKVYIVFFGLIHFSHIFSLFGILSSVSPSLYASFWLWNVILSLTCLVLPVIAVLIDNYVLYVSVAGASVVRILAEAFRLFIWTTDFYLMLAPFYALAAVFCLVLAAEDVASKASGEILSSQWSQF